MKQSGSDSNINELLDLCTGGVPESEKQDKISPIVSILEYLVKHRVPVYQHYLPDFATKEFQEEFKKLKDGGHIKTAKREGVEVFEISSSGKELYDSLKGAGE